MSETDPIARFDTWLNEAIENEPINPNAMTLATVAPDGLPDARMVLLKGHDSRGFAFFTNTRSPKGRDLAAHPAAALCFYWRGLGRQVRIVGRVEAVSDAEADAYFRTRPRGSQLGALVSDQSQPITHRELLEEKLAQLEHQYAEQEVPMPEHWGGYRVAPTLFEFWQGRPNRLHDRLRYTRLDNGTWRMQRLAP